MATPEKVLHVYHPPINEGPGPRLRLVLDLTEVNPFTLESEGTDAPGRFWDDSGDVMRNQGRSGQLYGVGCLWGLLVLVGVWTCIVVAMVRACF